MSVIIILSIIFAVYVGVIIYKFGMLSSISESWYRWKAYINKTFNPFSWFMLGLAITMWFLTDVYEFKPQAEIFIGLASFALGGAGIFSSFKDNDMVGTIHSLGAIICIICMDAVIIVQWWNQPWIWIPAGVTALFWTSGKSVKMDNLVLWVEIVAFVFIIGGLGYGMV